MKNTGDAEGGLPGLASLIGGEPDSALLRDLLRDVIDPEIGVNIVDLGLVYDIALSSDGVAVIIMTLTTPGCPLGGYLTDAVNDALLDVPGVTGVDVRIVWDPPWNPDEMMSDWAKDALGWKR